MTDLIDVAKWAAGWDTGLSSEAIAWHMISGWCGGSYPHDPADLGRCLRLLERFPEWKQRMPEMARYGKVWAALVQHWGELHKAMDDEVGIDWSKGREAIKTYRLMEKIEAEA